MPRSVLICSVLALLLSSGCVGKIRETTTVRTSTEQLLLSTAAERAIARFDTVDRDVRGKRVAIDDSKFESVDRLYVVSALRHWIAEHGARLVPVLPSKETPLPDRILELRSGALGINDKSFGIGIPPLPLPLPSTNIATETPALYLFYRGKQEGWAKFQIWILDPAKDVYVSHTEDLWGHTYASQWWILFAGPFECSNDIYPDEDKLGQPATKEERSEKSK